MDLENGFQVRQTLMAANGFEVAFASDILVYDKLQAVSFVFEVVCRILEVLEFVSVDWDVQGLDGDLGKGFIELLFGICVHDDFCLALVGLVAECDVAV